MKARFLAEAEAELREAARYYEERVPGLGLTFIAEVHRTTLQTAAQPEIGAPVEAEIRKQATRRFPYNILYASEPDGVLVIAVAHQRRRPYYWAKRKP